MYPVARGGGGGASFGPPISDVYNNMISSDNVTLATFWVFSMLKQVDARIVGGQEVARHSLPYQVAMIITFANAKSFCGGSLIAPKWVLTAAHCAEPGSFFTIYLGAHRIRDKECARVVMNTTEKIVHPKWDSDNLVNDIALLKLPRRVEYNEYIKPIRLPSREDQERTFVDVDALMSGWGLPSDATTSTSPVLRSVTKPVISKSWCWIRYPTKIQATHICTSGSYGQGVCSGDSGGPLVFTDIDGKKTEIGITSFGIGLGCEVGWPSVFTRVTSYLDWISLHTGIKIRDSNVRH